MLVLAVDTAARLCAACAFDAAADRVLARTVEDVGRGHAERLFAVIGRTLEEAGLAYGDFARLGVSVGPGSFTGLRVGVAATRGLAMALDVPVIGISAFDVLAQIHPRPLLAVINARRGEVYARLYGGKGAAGDPAVMPVARARALARAAGARVAGSGTPLVAGATGGDDNDGAGDAVVIARLAARAEAAGAPPSPLYLRPADAKPQTGFALARRKAAS